MLNPKKLVIVAVKVNYPATKGNKKLEKIAIKRNLFLKIERKYLLKQYTKGTKISKS